MKNDMEFIPETEEEKETVQLPGVAVDTHFDFKMDGWPAAAVLMTLCVSCVMAYGIAVWGQTRKSPGLSVS